MTSLIKIAIRVKRVLVATVLVGTSLVPITSFLAPVPVSAAACTTPLGGGGSGVLSLGAYADKPDSTVQKYSAEITKGSAWDDATDYFVTGINFADGSCASLDSSLYMSIDAARNLTVSFSDSNRASAFVATTDYDNVISGGVFDSATDNNATVEYTVPTISADEAQLLSVDLSSTPGWIDVSLKQGAGTDDLIVSFLAPTGTASFFSFTTGPTVVYGNFDDAFADCAAFTGSASADARILFDDVAQDLTISSDGLCDSYATSTYSSGTKTATLSYSVSGAAVQRSVVVDHTALASSGGVTSTLSSLETTGSSFKDSLLTSSSATQQVYIGVSTTQDGKTIKKDIPYPIAGFVGNFSAANVDLKAAGVTYDVSDTDTQHAAFVHKLGDVSVGGSFTLYVPYKDGDQYVGVCAGASSLTAVTNKCNGIYYVKDKQTKTSKDTKSIPANRSVKASIVLVAGKRFWQVEGLTGTGAFSANIASDPDTGLSINTTSMPIIVALMIGTLGAALLARRATAKR